MITSSTDHVWADIPGFGLIETVVTRSIDLMSQEAVAKRITALRQAKGMIQATFARMCGMSPQGLYNLEKGGQMPSTPTANGICIATGVDFDYIYRGILKDLPDELREIIPERLAYPREPPRPPKKRKPTI